MQTGFEYAQGSGAQDESAGAHGGFVHDHTVGVVEGAEDAGQFEKVGAQIVRAQVAERLFEDGDKAYELASQGDFGIGFTLRGIFLLVSGV